MKTVLITGCSSGYGLETARHFHARGWTVIASMRHPRPDLFPISSGIRVLPLDVTDTKSVRELAGQIGGKVDILINNARFIRPGGVLDRGDTTFAQQEFDARFECGFDGDAATGTNGFDQCVGKMDGANFAAFCFNKDRASRIKMM